jgi:hypothetical protein
VLVGGYPHGDSRGRLTSVPVSTYTKIITSRDSIVDSGHNKGYEKGKKEEELHLEAWIG